MCKKHYTRLVLRLVEIESDPVSSSKMKTAKFSVLRGFAQQILEVAKLSFRHFVVMLVSFPCHWGVSYPWPFLFVVVISF